jgi:D-beta-D-heptose 7-phosphate kinase/D-beta-D-heptose 1-phosphate adenosyltransferase
MKTIWINGCFDVLHYGHFKLIEYAKSFNGKLIIGIDSDSRVRKLKGEDRPFHNQQQREFNLMQIKGVDYVVVFNTEDELRNQLKIYKPDVFVIGDEYMYKPIIGGEHAKEIKFFPKLEEFSTTKILYNE